MTTKCGWEPQASAIAPDYFTIHQGMSGYMARRIDIAYSESRLHSRDRIVMTTWILVSDSDTRNSQQ